MAAVPMMLPGRSKDEHVEIDRKTKTAAIQEARSGLFGVEALIERAINENPPRFTPDEAYDIRNRYAMLAAKLEDALFLLAQERDEFEQLNFLVRRLATDKLAVKKQATEAQEKQTFWYTEAMRLRRIMDNEGLKYDEQTRS